MPICHLNQDIDIDNMPYVSWKLESATENSSYFTIMLLSYFKLPLVYNKHMYLDFGEKINSSLNDYFRFSIFALEKQKLKKENSNVEEALIWIQPVLRQTSAGRRNWTNWLCIPYTKHFCMQNLLM